MINLLHQSDLVDFFDFCEHCVTNSDLAQAMGEQCLRIVVWCPKFQIYSEMAIKIASFQCRKEHPQSRQPVILISPFESLLFVNLSFQVNHFSYSKQGQSAACRVFWNDLGGREEIIDPHLGYYL